MQFTTTVLQARKTATGLPVPPSVIEALGSEKRPAVIVTVNGGYTYRSTVGVELQYFESDDYVYRVVAGDPEASGLLHRMTVRGSDIAMPPVGSELVHPAGLDLVSDWIGGM